MLSRPDNAQQFLIPYIANTQCMMLHALRQLDPCAECEVVAAADLCVPHDVIRIAGGFPTGCLVLWRCAVPVIPVDTTVNIDTTSVFELSDDVDDCFTPAAFDKLRALIEERSSYEWNFHKGNHFISFCKRRSDGRPFLIIHSNEKEFKYQYNGLLPVDGNWFMGDVRRFDYGTGYIRLLVGERALLFFRMAKMCEEFNITRHAFFCDAILSKRARVESEYHKHHYYMPSRSAVVIGCYLCEPGEVVPILSAPGLDIELFEAHTGGLNKVRVDDTKDERLLVPHGWGKTSRSALAIVHKPGSLTVNGLTFANEPKVSLGTHPELETRAFATGNGIGSFCDSIRATCPGRVVDSYRQVAWYNRGGVCRASPI